LVGDVWFGLEHLGVVGEGLGFVCEVEGQG